MPMLPSISVVDDDPAVRSGLARMLRVAGYQVRTFPTAEAFLDDHDSTPANCLILDVRMPGMDGIELNLHLIESGNRVPVIFLTGHGDVPMAVGAMHLGVFDFIEKPFDKVRLLDRVRKAVELDAARREQDRVVESISQKLRLLTEREREVLDLLVAGLSVKEISGRLGTSRHTVKHQRTSVLQKMQAASDIELLRLLAIVRDSRKRS